MFDLEKSVMAWRRRMLAVGIESSALDELEMHLREEIERQMKSGTPFQTAFEESVAAIGEPRKLNLEFNKIRVPRSWQILAVLWFAGCLWSLNTVYGHGISNSGSPTLAFNSLGWFIYAAGLFGSFLLFRGSKYGASAIRMMALLILIACIAEISANHNALAWQIWCGLCALFSTVSIWLLRSPKQFKIAS